MLVGSRGHARVHTAKAAADCTLGQNDGAGKNSRQSARHYILYVK